MHPNQKNIETFYNALAAINAATVGGCYAAGARFDDEVFSLGGRCEAGGMRRMLYEASRAGGADVWKLRHRDVQADADSGHTHWDAHYLFSAIGWTPRLRRKVRAQATATLARFMAAVPA